MQDVIHTESAADVDPEEAANLVNEQMATWISHNPATIGIGAHRHEDDFEAVYLLRFTRHPRALERQIFQGVELEPVRSALAEAGLDTRLPSGAAILVHPGQYAAARQTMTMQPLRPYHVIVAASLYPLLLEAIEPLRSRCSGGVRVRQADPVAYVGSSNDAFVVENTFLDVPRIARRAQSVVQSTAEAHGCRNPRRLISE